MNRNQYSQHQEQMEAYRKEFAVVWRNHVERIQASVSAHDLAIMELRLWNQWREERKNQ